MPTIADARATPSIAAYWVKNSILAAVISVAVSLCVYGVRHATGAADADAGFGAIVIFYATATILWAFSGSADGLLTGAVLQRVVPLLPARIWIGLHASIAVVVGVGSERAFVISSDGPKGADDVSTGEMLLVGFILGAVIGAVIGGLQALVLRKVAFGTGAWMAWSTVAFAIAVAFFSGSASLWDTGGGLAGELANQAVAFLAAVIISLVMLPALRRLRDPLLSTAGRHFT
jgi:hypothetical protein